VILMIEKREAVEHLEEILAVPGIDMIQWGPGDYTVSIGKPGARFDPETKAVERRVIEAAIRRGIPPRAEIVTPADAKYYLDLGVRHFNLNVDLWILLAWWTSNGKALREALPA
jgi:2-keto-3-deoxy-L-rhamnonate aldolase RhmA